jgi:hypothetical protein
MRLAMRRRILLIVIGLAALAAGLGAFSGQLDTSEFHELFRRINEFLVRREFAKYGGYSIDAKMAAMWLGWVLGIFSVVLRTWPKKSELWSRLRENT